MSQSSISEPSAAADLGQTRWSLVAAVREGNAETARESLRALCRRYWISVYVYVRSAGYAADEAAGLVPAFLSRLTNRIREYAPGQATGFRVFLQQQLEEFLQRRPADLDAADVTPGLDPPWPVEKIEANFVVDSSGEQSPAEAMQRAFALELIAFALSKLKKEAEDGGRASLFAAVRPFLRNEPDAQQFDNLAQQLEMSPLAIVIAIKRLRQRFQELVDEELAETVGDRMALEQERQTLLTLAVPNRRS